MRESEKLLQMLLDKGANVNSVDERTNEKKFIFFIFKPFFYFYFFLLQRGTRRCMEPSVKATTMLAFECCS